MIIERSRRVTPSVLGIPLWPAWAIGSHVPLAVGVSLALSMALTRAVQHAPDWWVPIVIVLIAAAPSLWDRWAQYRRGFDDESHAMAIQELRLEIQALKDAREANTKTITELRDEITKSNRQLADALQTVIAHEATIGVLQNHLNQALRQVEQLTGGGPVKETMRMIELLKQPEDTIE